MLFSCFEVWNLILVKSCLVCQWNIVVTLPNSFGSAGNRVSATWLEEKNVELSQRRYIHISSLFPLKLFQIIFFYNFIDKSWCLSQLARISTNFTWYPLPSSINKYQVVLSIKTIDEEKSFSTMLCLPGFKTSYGSVNSYYSWLGHILGSKRLHVSKIKEANIFLFLLIVWIKLKTHPLILY